MADDDIPFDGIKPSAFVCHPFTIQCYNRAIKRYTLGNDAETVRRQIEQSSDPELAIKDLLRSVFRDFHARVLAGFQDVQTAADRAARTACIDYARSHLFHLTVTQPSAKHHALARSWLNAKRVGAFLQLFT